MITMKLNKYGNLDFKEWEAVQMQDPEFKKEVEALDHVYKIVRAVVDLIISLEEGKKVNKDKNRDKYYDMALADAERLAGIIWAYLED